MAWVAHTKNRSRLEQVVAPRLVIVQNGRRDAGNFAVRLIFGEKKPKDFVAGLRVLGVLEGARDRLKAAIPPAPRRRFNVLGKLVR
ncbi:MAG: hypothetical protein NBV67_00895 [Tagaea sp.]|nr:hypothetical protein [Tagaea sp.]